MVVGCAKQPDYSHSVGVPQGRLVFNANKRTKQLEKLLSPVVKINVGKMLCSSSHVGNGILLTAFHCVRAVLETKKGEKIPSITVSSPSLKAPIGPLTNYKISVPEMEELQTLGGFSGKGEINRIPDLAIIKLSGRQKVQLLSLPTLKISKDTLKEGDTRLILAGYGLESFGSYSKFGPFKFYHPGITGNLNDGYGTVAELTDFFYHTDYYEGTKDESAALPGDSGGPLLKKQDDGTYATYGVLSTLATGYDGGFFTPITLVLSNAYSRLDRKPVQEWLKKELAD